MQELAVFIHFSTKNITLYKHKKKQQLNYTKVYYNTLC
jgi:hypothetical protein